MKLLNRIVDKLQATFPPNRIVVILTPIIFVPASAWIAAWLTSHVPGMEVPAGAVVAVVATAAVSALILAYRWLDGWQRDEDRGYEDALEELADAIDSRPVEDAPDGYSEPPEPAAE